jgi:hypothetical protein
MNNKLKRILGKRPWPNLSYYPSICLEGLRNASQDRRSPGRDNNSGPPECERGVISTQSRY